MRNDELKKLWTIRFQRILNLEYESFYFYKKLIRTYRDLLEDSEAEEILRGIMRDEARHAHAASELLEIVNGKNESEKTNTACP